MDGRKRWEAKEEEEEEEGVEKRSGC